MNSDKTKTRFENKIVRIPMVECWIWDGHVEAGGYGKITIDGKSQWAHRVSWELYVGKIPDKLRVLHKCDIGACVNPEHLFLGTQLDNIRDCVNKKRTKNYSKPTAVAKGISNGNSKLTEEQVIDILKDTRKQKEITRDYKICRSTILRIKSKLSWKHIP